MPSSPDSPNLPLNGGDSIFGEGNDRELVLLINNSDPALRDGVSLKVEASPQVVTKAKNNMAGFVLANGSMSSNQSGKGETQQNQLRNGSRPTCLGSTTTKLGTTSY